MVGSWLSKNLDDPEEFEAATASMITIKDTFHGLAESWMSIRRILLLRAPQAAVAYLIVGYMYTLS